MVLIWWMSTWIGKLKCRVITLLLFQREEKSVFYESSARLLSLSSHRGLSVLHIPSLPAVSTHLRVFFSCLRILQRCSKVPKLAYSCTQKFKLVVAWNSANRSNPFMEEAWLGPEDSHITKYSGQCNPPPSPSSKAMTNLH